MYGLEHDSSWWTIHLVCSQPLSWKGLEVCSRILISRRQAALTFSSQGTGTVLFITDQESPPQLPTVNMMNFNSSVASTFKWTDWAAVDEEYTPSMYLIYCVSCQLLICGSVRAPTAVQEFKSDGQKDRIRKRKAVADLADSMRQDLFAGEWNG